MALKNFFQKTAAVLLALLVWQAAAMAINESILLVSPASVFIKLLAFFKDSEFWHALLYTFKRITIGFLLGLCTGVVFAFFAVRFKTVKSLLWPYVITIKSVPVASFIVIAMIWLSSAKLSVFITFLMVFPIVYTNLVTGAEETSAKMLQMAQIFKLSKTKRLLYITLPQIKPYLISACGVSIGLAWKSGVAAEVIAIPEGSIGEALYQSKVYFATEELFAWTVAIVLCSILFEKLFILAIKWCFTRMEKL